ncbi:MAG: hypothetical protein ACM3VT_07580 [Solirubrobacterales bacterium]
MTDVGSMGLSSLSSIDSGISAADSQTSDAKAMAVSKDFESVLLTKVFEEVQKSIEESGFDEEDGGAEQVRGLFWFYLAQDVGEKGGFGLWKDIYQQLKPREGVSDPKDNAGANDPAQKLAGSIDEEL